MRIYHGNPEKVQPECYNAQTMMLCSRSFSFPIPETPKKLNECPKPYYSQVFSEQTTYVRKYSPFSKMIMKR
jgi:hypothetical protein